MRRNLRAHRFSRTTTELAQPRREDAIWCAELLFTAKLSTVALVPVARVDQYDQTHQLQPKL
jgi:hypothetical protein